MQKAHCTYYAEQCLSCAELSSGSERNNLQSGKTFHRIREGLWLTWYAAQKVGNFFGRKLEKLEIFTFLVAQLLPLCTSFDCTAVSMQQRFDNLGFLHKNLQKSSIFWKQFSISSLLHLSYLHPLTPERKHVSKFEYFQNSKFEKTNKNDRFSFQTEETFYCMNLFLNLLFLLFLVLVCKKSEKFQICITVTFVFVIVLTFIFVFVQIIFLPGK